MKRLIVNAGPADALLTAGNLTAGQSFDSGNACASGTNAFVFVKNSCQLPSMATVNVSQLNLILGHTACCQVIAYGLLIRRLAAEANKRFSHCQLRPSSTLQA